MVKELKFTRVSHSTAKRLVIEFNDVDIFLISSLKNIPAKIYDGIVAFKNKLYITNQEIIEGVRHLNIAQLGSKLLIQYDYSHWQKQIVIDLNTVVVDALPEKRYTLMATTRLYVSDDIFGTGGNLQLEVGHTIEAFELDGSCLIYITDDGKIVTPLSVSCGYWTGSRLFYKNLIVC
jgi:hypothetical protein